MPVNYLRPEKFSLKSHPELNERWVQDRIADVRSGNYRFRLTKEDPGKHRGILRELIQLAYESRNP